MIAHRKAVVLFMRFLNRDYAHPRGLFFFDNLADDG